MKVLKANYKIEEKNGMITSIDGHSQDEAKGLYWMYKINGEMAPKGAAETTVKKGDKIEFYQEVYNEERVGQKSVTEFDSPPPHS